MTAELITASPNLYIEREGRRETCAPGRHFGSRYPGDPTRTPVYDFVPDVLLRQVINADCFLGMVAFDQWVSNADGRQAVFLRDRAGNWLYPRSGAGGGRSVDPERRGYIALMIDHGFAFTAHHWTFRDLAHTGLYPDRKSVV